MKIIESWLREWINPPLTIQQIAEQLTMAGLEVAEVHAIAADFKDVVVGEVVAVQPHPNADRLNLCQVNIGTDQPPLSIVCGASNVRVGLKAPVAVVGAELPNNFIIKKAKLRGIESCGMLCSAKELKLDNAETEISKGLMELASDAPIGMDLKQYLKLDDNIVEIELTANRGDCLSMLGIAREVAALNNLGLSLTKFAEIEKQLVASEHEFINSDIPITLAAPAACPNYAACLIQGINNKVITPAWLKERLEKSGLRSVNPVVDVANYVMLELGQPLHTFSLNKIKIADGIVVRYARDQEKITTLDGNELTLTSDTLIIADKNDKVLAVAGVIGGKDSAIDENSTDILIESAYFAPEVIRKTSQRYGLKTDAAYRFERGVDPTLQNVAAARARQLILEIAGGSSSGAAIASRIVTATAVSHLPVKKPIAIDYAMIDRLLGFELSRQIIVSILQGLAMQVQELDGGKLNVTAPPHRFDINIAEDLIEEIARIYGYDKLPIKCIKADFTVRGRSESLRVSDREIKNLLVTKGYCEAITYSFIAAQLQKIFDPDCEPQTLVNPISSEMAVMRTNLFPGLINALQHNLNRRQNRIRLFEIGLCFRKNGDSLEQKPKVAGVITGEALSTHWDSAITKRAVDFYDIKSDVEFLLQAFHYPEGNIVFSAATHPAFHPKRCAAISLSKELLGYVGEMHPQIRQTLEIKQPIYFFELDLSALQNKTLPRFNAISKLPAIERDLAFIIDHEMPWQLIKDKVQAVGGELLQNVEVFDIYHGDKIEKTKKSIALRLRFQHLSHTLTDNEVDVLLQKIIKTLEQDCSAVLRACLKSR